MHILHVHIRVKEPSLAAFMAATRINAENSRLEPGVARFDVLQQTDDPTRVTLVEVYKTPADHAAHRETKHYANWRAAVAEMMAEPRTAVTYTNASPDDSGW